MKFGLSARSARRPLALIASAVLAAATLVGCGGSGGGGGQDGGDAGSATSGTVNWWGWTPTDTATAKGYIDAFNKEYPDIKVNYKLVSIPDWQAALRPGAPVRQWPGCVRHAAWRVRFRSTSRSPRTSRR